MKWWLSYKIFRNIRNADKCLLKISCISNAVLSGFKIAALKGKEKSHDLFYS
ncbi:rCG44597 [Rattus norvegicus]|uniref:RCG44597 n=1 Tax=Rattus norvegicus TaxID=10116 RepID=A6I5W6_RAT|nr:rCG44597 [Rattus norvegicus]